MPSPLQAYNEGADLVEEPEGSEPLEGGSPLSFALPDVRGAVSALRRPTQRDSVSQLIDTFAARIPHLAPSPADYMSERARMMDAETRGNMFYNNPPIDPNIALLRSAAGFLKPTKTGSPGESVGQGIEGYATGRAEEQQQRLKMGDRAAQFGYDAARHGYEDVVNREKQALDALAKLGVLARSDQLLNVNRFKVVAQVGLVDTQQVDAQGNPKVVVQSPALGAIFAKYEDSLRRVLAREFAFQDPQALEAEVQRRMGDFKQRFSANPLSVLNDPLLAGAAPAPSGAPAAAPAPAAGPGPSPQPAAPAPQPSAAPPAATGKPWDQFIPPPPTATPGAPGKGTVGYQSALAGGKEAAKSGEQVVESYLKETVYPGQIAAQASLSNAVIAESILRKDPRLTGAGKEFMANVANWMVTLGMAPEAAKNFATDMSIFKSAATLDLLSKQIAQKGPQTESDARRMFEAGLNMANPVEANLFIARLMKSYAKRGIERSEFFADWRDKRGGMMAGAVDAWNRYERSQPFVTIVDGKPYFWNELRDFNAKRGGT